MKELKFRAWDKNKCKMAEVIEITFNIMFKTMKHTLVRYRHELYNGKIENESEYIDEKGNGNIVLMQYTGLKDKNGKEIYEGDICKSTRGYDFIVNWEESTVRFLGKVITKTQERYCCYIDEVDKNGEVSVEVIGNIYENKDLLEV